MHTGILHAKLHLVARAVVVATTGALFACSGNGASPPKLQSLTLGARTYAAVGVPQQLKVSGTYSDGVVAEVKAGLTWSSSDQTVATVDPSGLVTSWAKGTAQIVVTHESGLSARTELAARMIQPVSITSLPMSGSVDTTAVYYRVTGLTAGRFYTISVTQPTDDVDLVTYSDSTMTSQTQLCSSEVIGTADESCVAPASASGEIWVMVDGQWTRSGASFKVAVAADAPVSVIATLAYPAQFPYAGSVGVARQYFKVTGLTPGSKYEAKISNLTGDLDLEVYGDSYEYAKLCDAYHVGIMDEACTATVGASGEFVVEVDGEPSVQGSNYTLTLTAK